MAQQGVIFPREPLIIVDRKWRPQRRNQVHYAEAKDTQLEVLMIKNNPTSDKGLARTHPGRQKKRIFQFVQSSNNSKDIDKALYLRKAASQRRKSRSDERSDEIPTYQACKRQETCMDVVTHQSGESNMLGIHPTGSSTAFYSNLKPDIAAQSTELLKYYPVVITDSFYPLRAKVSFDFNPIASVWLPFAMQDEALLSTIMLSSAIQAKNLNPEAYSQTTRHLFTSAIRTIDRRLSSSMLTDATIGAVSCLVLIELALDQHEKSAVHGSGLVEMIRLRGGIGSINRSLQMKIYRAAILPAVSSLSRPPLPRLRPSVPPLHTMLVPDVTNAEHYRSMLAICGLNLELIDVMFAIYQLSNTVDSAIKRGIEISERAFNEDTMNILHDLLSHSGLGTTCLNNACKYAALVYMSTLTIEAPLSAAACRNVAGALLTELEGLEPISHNNRLALWMTFMGGLASSATVERPLFRLRLASTCRDLGIMTWDECKDILERICWIDKVHDEAGELLWTEIDPILTG